MPSPAGRAADAVRRLDRSVILRAATLCDGHSILRPQAFEAAGVPADVVGYLVRNHRSDGTPKGTIFVDGQAVHELRGVYGLDCLRFIASALAVQYRLAIGRGFEAANIRHALAQHLAPVQDRPDAAADHDGPADAGGGDGRGGSSGSR